MCRPGDRGFMSKEDLLCCLLPPSIWIPQKLSVAPLCSYRKQHHMTNSIGPPSGLAFDACVHSGRLVSKTKSTFVIYLKHTQMGLGKGLVDLVKR